jgi:hypothetical protein
MKRISTLIFLICIAVVGLNAKIDLSFSPSQIRVNELKTLSFDPIRPQTQPLLTTLTMTNKGAADKVNLEILLSWNGEFILNEGEARFISKEPLAKGGSIVLTNRDLISQEGNHSFSKDGDFDFDIIEILSNLSNLKDAVLAGSFPDGVLVMEVKTKPESAPENEWQRKSFSITVRNLNSITPLSPGKPIGQVAPKITDLPATFFWQVQKTDFNKKEYLVIYEFPPNRAPTPTNITSSGRKVFEGEADSGFNQFLPFNDGYTYVWQVYIPLYDIYNPDADFKRSHEKNILRSNWFTFQYKANRDEAEAINEFQAALNMLKNKVIDSARNLGYTPLGDVILNGKTYRGMEAIDIIMELVGTEFDAEMME